MNFVCDARNIHATIFRWFSCHSHDTHIFGTESCGFSFSFSDNICSMERALSLKIWQSVNGYQPANRAYTQSEQCPTMKCTLAQQTNAKFRPTHSLSSTFYIFYRCFRFTQNHFTIAQHHINSVPITAYGLIRIRCCFRSNHDDSHCPDPSFSISISLSFFSSTAHSSIADTNINDTLSKW